MEELDLYALIGEDGFHRLIAAFYRQVPNDDVLGPMYPNHDFAGAEGRLRDFLIGRFGGPQRYIEQRGHPRLRMRHMGFPIGASERDTWFHHMSEAVRAGHLEPADEAEMLEYFANAADHLVNRP